MVPPSASAPPAAIPALQQVMPNMQPETCINRLILSPALGHRIEYKVAKHNVCSRALAQSTADLTSNACAALDTAGIASTLLNSFECCAGTSLRVVGNNAVYNRDERKHGHHASSMIRCCVAGDVGPSERHI